MAEWWPSGIIVIGRYLERHSDRGEGHTQPIDDRSKLPEIDNQIDNKSTTLKPVTTRMALMNRGLPASWPGPPLIGQC